MAQLRQHLQVEYRTREVQAFAKDGQVLSTAEFIEQILFIKIEPWQRRICDWVDAAKQG